MTCASSSPTLPLSNRRRPAADAGSGGSRRVRSRPKWEGATVSELRAVHEWDDHWPDYGTLVFREAWPGQPEDLLLPSGLLPPDEFGDPDDMVNGALALTGVGWFHGNLRAEGRPALRVEVWDGPPPEDDGAGWADADLVADLPYWSPGGAAVLNYLVPMDGGPEFALLGPGPYGIRTWCRPLVGEPAEGWRSQFWPLRDSVPEPARWRRRAWTRPTGTELGWSRYFGEDVDVLISAIWVVSGSGVKPGAGVAELETHFQGWGRPGYLDGPTGWGARRDEVRGFARELGVPVPAIRRMLLNFLVAAGRLRRADDGGVARYEIVPDAPRADQVLALPAEDVAAIAAANAPLIHGELARDVRAAVLWSPHRLLDTTRAGLARRLQADPDAVTGALTYLADQSRLAVHGDYADPDAPLVLAAELPETDHGDPYQRQLHENLLRAAGRPIPADPVDPAPPCDRTATARPGPNPSRSQPGGRPAV